MSRSYKHVPCAHFVRRHKGMKRLFNKRVRRLDIDGVGSYGGYKKANEIWDDDDWRVVHHMLDHYRALDAEGARQYHRAFLAK